MEIERAVLVQQVLDGVVLLDGLDDSGTSGESGGAARVLARLSAPELEAAARSLAILVAAARRLE